MKKVYEKFAKYIILRTVLFLVLGTMLLLFPAQVMDAIVYIVGGFLVVWGIIYIVKSVTDSDRKGLSFEIVAGIILIIIGVLLFIFTDIVTNILHIFMGVLLILAGLSQLFSQIRAKDMGAAGISRIVICILIIAGGILGIMLSAKPLEVIFRLFGCFTILLGANELIYLIRAKQLAKQIKNTITPNEIIIDDATEKDNAGN